jgi:hypothetical protein
MSSIERGECETTFFEGTKCHYWFCKNKPTWRKLVYPLFGFKKYVPSCEKHLFN